MIHVTKQIEKNYILKTISGEIGLCSRTFVLRGVAPNISDLASAPKAAESKIKKLAFMNCPLQSFQDVPKHLTFLK